MQIEIKQTEFYAKWFGSLKDRNAKLRIDARIRRLSLGNPGDTKPVGDGISEIRIDYGPGYRVYFTQRNKELILLLIGGDKSSQTKDIAKAKEIAKEL
ncbi:MAG TPA: type II toxin-antitoxin system RelE/ParE family toxin [Pyrinomonadaceae bacterium]|nr:type II toxin-antitoxin system RelE/ParE family toxin [Pyrinomonadaceae bacterium]